MICFCSLRRRCAGSNRFSLCLMAFPGLMTGGYALSSLAADPRITQVVNGSKGVHVMLEKSYLTRG
jgi:hypothetical protein